MKRYRIVTTLADLRDNKEMVEDPDGEWIKVDDLVKMLLAEIYLMEEHTPLSCANEIETLKLVIKKVKGE